MNAKHTLRCTMLVGLCTIVASGLTGCWSDDQNQGFTDPAVSQAGELGPLVARVGSLDLHRSQIAPLADLALELRREFELPVQVPTTFAARRDLAVELLSLAQAAGDQESVLELHRERQKRLLAKLYLDRIMEQLAQRPVNDDDLKQAYGREIESYYSTMESDIYEPTLVDAMVIAVGQYPSLTTFAESDIPPVLESSEAQELAAEIKRACGERVVDLDEFLLIARRFSRGNPTVRVETFDNVGVGAVRARMPAGFFEALMDLDAYGAISPVVWSGSVAWIIRRGRLYPGRGENWQDIRDQLTAVVNRDRRQVVYEKVLASLRRRYKIVTWSGTLDRFEDRRKSR